MARAGGSSPQRQSTIRSTGTTRLASMSSIASTARCFGAPRSTPPAAPSTSSGPRIRKFTADRAPQVEANWSASGGAHARRHHERSAPMIDNLTDPTSDLRPTDTRVSPNRAGLACAVLLVVGAALMLSGIPDPEDSDQVITSYLHDHTTLTISVIGCFVWTAALFCFLRFATDLRRVLRTAERDESSLTE